MLPASIFPTPGAVSGAWICLQLGMGGSWPEEEAPVERWVSPPLHRAPIPL